MSQPPGNSIYIPPFSGVRLVECRDHFQLVTVPDVRKVYGYGKIKTSMAVDPDDPEGGPLWSNLGPDVEVWAVMQWYVFTDEHREPGDITYLRPECTEDEVKRSLDMMIRRNSLTREEMLRYSRCFKATKEDYDYIDRVCPNYQSEPDPTAADEYDVYHARLKVLSDLQPKTVALLKIANLTKDPEKQRFVECEAVQSFFAELAHYFTEDEVLAWQKSNPVGTGWMCEFAEVMGKPRRQLDPINHDLALNWLRDKYNEMTAKELSLSVWRRVWRWLSPGFQLTAAFIKDRRKRLGLTTKRPPGPRPRMA